MQRLDLNHLPEQQRFDAWKNITEPFFAVSRAEPAGGAFQCRMATRQWGDALLIETDVSGQRYDHTAQHARCGGWDQIAFQMYRKGTFKGLYGEAIVQAGPGDINVIDMSQPYAKESSDEQDLNLILPRDTVETRLSTLRHGTVLRGDRALGRLAAAHLAGLSNAAERLGEADATKAIAAFLVLLSGTPLAEADPEVVPFVRSTARRIAENYLRRHLAQPEIDMVRLARHCGLSRASLYRLFQSDGGVQAFVRRERLERARRLIEERPHEPLQDIADACGFNDAAGFSRAFRRAFQLSPGEWRRERREDSRPAARTPEDWIETVLRFRSGA